jgi:hypothetical protein
VRRVPRSARVRRPPGERALAWLYTGPLGHLYGTLADIAVLWAKWIGGKVRSRVRGG